MSIHASVLRWTGFLILVLAVTVQVQAHENHEHATEAQTPPASMEADDAHADSGHMHEAGTVHTAGEAETGAELPRWMVVTGRFHPLVVHLPIGLLLTAALLHLVNLWLRSPAVAAFVRIGLFAGAIVAVVAAGLGWLDAAGADHGDAALVERHRWIGVSLACVAVAAAAVSEAAARARGQARFWRVGLVLAAASLLALVVLAGHSGGAVVYGADYPFGP